MRSVSNGQDHTFSGKRKGPPWLPSRNLGKPTSLLLRPTPYPQDVPVGAARLDWLLDFLRRPRRKPVAFLTPRRAQHEAAEPDIPTRDPHNAWPSHRNH